MIGANPVPRDRSAGRDGIHGGVHRAVSQAGEEIAPDGDRCTVGFVAGWPVTTRVAESTTPKGTLRITRVVPSPTAVAVVVLPVVNSGIAVAVAFDMVTKPASIPVALGIALGVAIGAVAGARQLPPRMHEVKTPPERAVLS